MFTIFKCPLCHESIERHREDFCYATVYGSCVVRVEKTPPTECPAGGRVFELHERCREAFGPAPL